jgi:hypothetical protein
MFRALFIFSNQQFYIPHAVNMCQSSANTVYLYLCHSASFISSRLSAIYNISKAYVLVVYHGKFLVTNVDCAPPRSNVKRMCKSTKMAGKISAKIIRVYRGKIGTHCVHVASLFTIQPVEYRNSWGRLFKSRLTLT